MIYFRGTVSLIATVLLFSAGCKSKQGQVAVTATKVQQAAVGALPAKPLTPAVNGEQTKTASAAISPFIISLNSGDDLLLTDPQGRKTGFDVAGNKVFDEIPGASYGDESITDPNDDSDNPTRIDDKTLDLQAPKPGIYTLTIYGTQGVANL